MPGEHAMFSPSSVDRWTNCPGSIKRSEGIESKSSRYAEEGTAAHEVCEKCLTVGVDADTFVGKVVNNVEVTSEMAKYCQKYIDYVMSVVRETGGELHVEKRLPIGIHGKCFGTADAIVCEPYGAIHVIDLKYGVNPVDPERNGQVALYGLGAYEEFGKEEEFTKLVTHIAQPRVAICWPPSPYTWTLEELEEFKVEKTKAARRCTRKGAIDNLSEGSWCRYCPAAALKCPLKQNRASVAAEIHFQDSPDELAEALDAVAKLKPWIKQVEEYALEQARDGVEIKGYALAPGRSTRVWSQEDNLVIEAVSTLTEIPYEMIVETKLTSVAKIEKLMGKKFFEQNMGEFVDKKEGNLVLKPAKKAEEYF